jgi:hypothetical protein
MTKGDQTYQTKITIGLDPRSPFTVADRRAQFDAAMKVHAMFGDMSDLVARIQAVRTSGLAAAAKLPEGEALRAQLAALTEKADTLRKEGGAITGEERLREHMSDLYGGILQYEGRPAATLIAYTAALRRELDDVAAEFESFRAKELRDANAALKAKGLPEIAVPESIPVAWELSGETLDEVVASSLR